MTDPACPLCPSDAGLLIVRTPQLRVVRAEEAGFPAFYRVIWNAHVAEFSDLSAADRQVCMDAVLAVERTLRQHLAPTKINLASLGNVVPHLHWHVIARFQPDSHFPAPVWATAQRPVDAALQAHITSLLPTVEAAIQAALAAPQT